jgi:ATP-dependent RNA helicase RhlE
VLDEADRMLDMGFIHDIRRVLAKLPPRRQNLLFSATFSDEIKALAEKLLHNPLEVEVARRNTASEQVTQHVHFVDKKRKRELLSQMIGQGNWQQVLVFTRTKHGANHLAEQLNKDGIRSAAIHGNKSQGARTRALAEFKSGDIRVLVATDIAARGLDIEELPHVVNYELPNVPEDYVHRIGRTGRAAATGEALSLVCVDEHKLLRDIERLLKKRDPAYRPEGYDVDPSIKAEPIQNGRQGGGGGGRGQGGAGGAVSSRVVLKAVHRKPRANLRVVIQRLSQAVKAHGVAARGNRQGKGSADAARVNLLTRSNLEARP